MLLTKSIFLYLILKKTLYKKTKPAGKLTISTTVGFGSTWLTPRINKFTEQYPDIQVSLLMSDEEVDLSKRIADVAVRVKKPTQANLIFKNLLIFIIIFMVLQTI